MLKGRDMDPEKNPLAYTVMSYDNVVSDEWFDLNQTHVVILYLDIGEEDHGNEVETRRRNPRGHDQPQEDVGHEPGQQCPNNLHL